MATCGKEAHEDEREREKGTSSKTLIPFLVIAFGLAWGIIALLILFPEQIEAVFGAMGYTNPLFILAMFARKGAVTDVLAGPIGRNGLTMPNEEYEK